MICKLRFLLLKSKIAIKKETIKHDTQSILFIFPNFITPYSFQVKRSYSMRPALVYTGKRLELIYEFSNTLCMQKEEQATSAIMFSPGKSKKKVHRAYGNRSGLSKTPGQ